MTTTDHDIAQVIAEKIESYADEADVWLKDHVLAMAYFDFCALLGNARNLYKDICRLDENWRRRVYRGETEYTEEFASTIDRLFSEFSKVAFDIETILLPYFDGNYGVSDAEDFRRICRELRDSATPDAEFFDHSALVDLRDKALDDHAKGNTCEPWAT